MNLERKALATEWVPETVDLAELRAAANQCQGCGLYRLATQVVFGEGPPSARVVMVGEQPGDQEDKQGKPFVGPAGKLLDKALDAAGISRSDIYITNAVKHFKFTERGKRRINSKPNSLEISACRPWLDAEIAAVRPEIVVCLGATAARSFMGRNFRVRKERGVFNAHPWAKAVMVTIHPSALLRTLDSDQRKQEYKLFLRDLKRIKKHLDHLSAIR